MPRKRCCGLIEVEPVCRHFTPAGLQEKETIVLWVEELEAVRLKDREKLDQQACAEMMGLTRPTFQRILHTARSKIAQALVEGLPLTIKGGNYMIKNRTFECQDCGHRWEEKPCTEGGRHGYEIACPGCGSMKKNKITEDGGRQACGGKEHHGGCCGH